MDSLKFSERAQFPMWLFDLVQAPIRWQIVHLAFQHHLFNRLCEPTPVEALASDTGFDATRLGLYLNALTALGLLHKQDGRFCVVSDIAPFLLDESDLCLREMFLSLSDLRHGNIEALLCKTETIPAADMASADHWDKSARSLAAFHKTMAAKAMLECLEQLPEWQNIRHLVDVGAGSDILARLVTKKFTEKHVTILDLPPLATRMQKSLAQTGEDARRINVLSGNYNQINIPHGCDLIWASMTLYFADDLTELLTRWRSSLAPNGLFVSLHEELRAERTLPQPHVIGRLIPAMTGHDSSFDAGAMADTLSAAGFSYITVKTIEFPTGPMTLTVGRV